MKLLKANNFNQALKEMKSLDAELAETLNEDIKNDDRKMYHVISITIEAVAGAVKNNVSFNVIKLHKHGFERLKKNKIFQGIAKLIVLHDPSLLDEKPEIVVPLHMKISIAEKVKREMKAKHDAEIQAEIDRQTNESLNPEPKSEITVDNLEDTRTPDEIALAKQQEAELDEAYLEVMENGKKADLIAFCVDYGIEGIDEAKDNDERKALIKTWYEQK